MLIILRNLISSLAYADHNPLCQQQHCTTKWVRMRNRNRCIHTRIHYAEPMNLPSLSSGDAAANSAHWKFTGRHKNRRTVIPCLFDGYYVRGRNAFLWCPWKYRYPQSGKEKGTNCRCKQERYEISKVIIWITFLMPSLIQPLGQWKPVPHYMHGANAAKIPLSIDCRNC